MASRPIRFRVIPQESGMPVATLVTRRVPGLKKKQGIALVKAGAVYMGHLRVRVPSTRVAEGERITIYPDTLKVEELDPAEVSFVHRDPAFAVVDKAAGVPVAATKATARGTLSEAVRRVLRDEGVERPYVGVLHRLDQGASGLIVLTTRGVANKSLHKDFASHAIERTYRVRVMGEAADAFECNAPLVDRPGTDSMKVARSGEPRAKQARTRFRRLEPTLPIEGTSLLEVTLETGRSHQIRLHASESGHPVYGDRRYGPDETEAPRLHLHAWRLQFDHPLKGERLDLSSPLPAWAASTEDDTAALPLADAEPTAPE